jgi:hypothetical protein
MEDNKTWRLENLEPTQNDSEIDESENDESKTDEDEGDDEEDNE